jgi:hypothetical protein
MFTGFYEFIVEQNSPLHMKKFSVAMCHKVSTRTFTTKVPCSKIFEMIWKLEDDACMSVKIEPESASTRMWLK